MKKEIKDKTAVNRSYRARSATRISVAGKGKSSKKKTTKKTVTRNKSVNKKEALKEIRNIEKEIRKLMLGYENSIKTQTEHDILLGKQFNRLKPKLRKIGVKWKDYLKDKWPHMTERTDLRRRTIAKSADIRKYPAISYLTGEKLEKLTEYFKKGKIGENLFMYGIDPHLVERNYKSIDKFKQEVDELIFDLSKGNLWFEVDQSNYSKGYSSAIDKLNRKVQRREKKNLKKQGKFDKDELENSIKRSTLRLIKDLNIVLYKQDKIVGDTSRPIEIPLESLKSLLRLIKTIFLIDAGKGTNKFKNADFPDENDV